MPGLFFHQGERARAVFLLIGLTRRGKNIIGYVLYNVIKIRISLSF